MWDLDRAFFSEDPGAKLQEAAPCSLLCPHCQHSCLRCSDDPHPPRSSLTLPKTSRWWPSPGWGLGGSMTISKSQMGTHQGGTLGNSVLPDGPSLAMLSLRHPPGHGLWLVQTLMPLCSASCQQALDGTETSPSCQAFRTDQTPTALGSGTATNLNTSHPTSQGSGRRQAVLGGRLKNW